jgi:hypothetical protein
MPRCAAKTSTGRRCKCAAAADSDRCANHATAVTYGSCEMTPADEAVWRTEATCGDPEFVVFSRAYYNTLRELYNVAGAEMVDEYVSYRCLGLSGYNKMHEKRHKGFHAMVKRDDPNSYYSLFVFIERRRQEKRAAARSARTAPDLSGNSCLCGANRGVDCDCWEDRFREADEPIINHCPICGVACEPADEDGHCSYECATGGGFHG